MSMDPLPPEASEAQAKRDRSVAALLSDLAGESVLLVRQEVALLRAELHEKLSQAGQGVTALGAGALIAFSGWLALVAAAVLGLALVVPPWAAALIVGFIGLLIGAILAWIGKGRLDAKALLPGRTLRSLREDEAWLKERLR